MRFLKFFKSLRRNRQESRQTNDPISRPPLQVAEIQGGSIAVEGLPSAANRRTVRRTIWHGLKNAVGVAKEASDFLPPLKAALGGLVAVLKTCDQVVGNKEKVVAIIARLESFEAGLSDECNARELERRNTLQQKLDLILRDLRQILDQNKMERVANSARDEQILSGHVEAIRTALIDYQVSIQQDLYRMEVNSIQKVDLMLLEKLPRAKDAGCLSGNRQECLPGTREDVLRLIVAWLEDLDNRRVYWLNGLAGSGKSTITQTFTTICHERGILGASFFCSRDYSDRSNLHLIFPTLAFQLAHRFPAFRAALVLVINSSIDVGHISLADQLEMLVVGPLQVSKIPAIIIIDALDECKDDEPASTILSLLARHIDKIPFVKFFITGRPEPPIRSGFRLPLLRPHTEVFLLHDVDRTSVDRDIEIYLRSRFTELVANRSDFDVANKWPTPEDIATIIKKCSGLFICASTIIRYVSSNNHNPQNRLQIITNMPDDTRHEGQSGLNALYTNILEDGLSEVDHEDFEFFLRLRHILSLIILAYDPLSLQQLSILLNLATRDIFATLRSLHSLLIVPDSERDAIRISHKSLADYLTDPKRCTNPHLYINPSVHHGVIARFSLELLEAKLHHNICRLPSGAMNKEIEDLHARRRDFIGDALEYGCKFWAKHLRSFVAPGSEAVNVLQLLKKLFTSHLLNWLEVLSIIDDLRSAIYSLHDVQQWLLEIQIDLEGLASYVSDSQQFILNFFDPIQESAQHIYDSALRWCPESTVIRMNYLTAPPTGVSIVRGLDHSWNACSRTIETLGMVFTLKYSHNGEYIAACGVVLGPASIGWAQIYEANTGICLATMLGTDGLIGSLGFSPDDSFLASGSGKEGAIQIWDVKTGALSRTLIGHKESIASVEFSQNGKMLVSSSRDHSVRVWDVSSGECRHKLEGHSTPLLSACWSPTGEEIISGSGDGKVHFWSAVTGVCTKTVSVGPITSMEFCEDVSRFVSVHGNKTVTIFDTGTGDIVKQLTPDIGPFSACFSRDPTLIAYGTFSNICVHDLSTNVVLATFECQGATVIPVVFSPSGKSVASGSFPIIGGGFVRVWQIDAATSSQSPPEDHSGPVNSVCFSADGKYVASASEDNTVKLWDPSNGDCVHTLCGHTDGVNAVAFSPDSSLIASGSGEHLVRIWNVHTRQNTMVLEGCRYGIKSVAFSPDGQRVVAGTELGEIRLWSLETGDTIATTSLGFGEETPSTILFSPEGTSIMFKTRSKDSFRIFNLSPNHLVPSSSSPAPESIQFQSSSKSSRPHFTQSTWSTSSSSRSSLSSSFYRSPITEPTAVPLPFELEPLPDELVPSDSPTHEVPWLFLPDGWIADRTGRRIFWLPHDCRGWDVDFCGSTLAIAARSGKVVILKF